MNAYGCRRLGIGIALLALLLAGRGSVRGEAPGAAVPEAPVVGQSEPGAPASEIRDDFSDPASGWTRETEDRYGADYYHGSYVVWVDNDHASLVIPSGAFAGREFTDSRLVIKATKLYGPDEAHLGLSCREWHDDTRRGVYFADIDGEGKLRIGLYDEDGQEVLATAMRPHLWRRGSNTLQLDCIGNDLRFFVNGVEVLVAQDDRFQRGRVGVRAGGAASGVTRVAFDDAVIGEGR